MHLPGGPCSRAQPKPGQQMLHQSQCVPVLLVLGMLGSTCMPCIETQRAWLVQDPFAVKEEYYDGPFDRFMVSYFASKMSEQLGGEAHVPSCQHTVQERLRRGPDLAHTCMQASPTSQDMRASWTCRGRL